MQVTLEMVRTVLDQLRDAGLDVYEIARCLDLKQIQGNPRTIERWYSGKTACRTVEYRALRDLLNEVNHENT